MPSARAKKVFYI